MEIGGLEILEGGLSIFCPSRQDFIEVETFAYGDADIVKGNSIN